MTAPTGTAIPDTIQKKRADLEAALSRMGSVVVAYSGGVDSTFLSATAGRVLGAKALAVTASSPSLAPAELRDARAVAESIGLNYRVVYTQEVDRPEYQANDPNRCFFCKDHLYTHLKRIAAAEGYAFVATGANLDDLGDFRPGLNAAKRHGVQTPLAEAGLFKEEIRRLSREMGLPNWDKASQACLSSRIPYGTKVSVDALVRVAKAEKFLHGLGIKQLRVRHHDTLARIEVELSDFATLITDEVREAVTRYFRAIGYAYVALDLDGFRSGSLNEVLPGMRKNREAASQRSSARDDATS